MTTSIGMNRQTGRFITDIDHLRQSIGDIMTTHILTRVMRRQYGSESMRLVDQIGNDQVILAYYSAIAEALLKWEPRYELTDLQLEAYDAEGRASLAMFGIYRPRGHHGDMTPANDTGIAITLVETAEGGWRAVA